MHNITTNLHIYTLKSANSAVFPLTPPLTPYHSPRCDLYKYTEVKISSYHRKLITEQKFSLPVLPILKTKTRHKVFRYLPTSGTKAQPYIRKLYESAKFSFAVVVIYKT